jgi:two-component system response regulator FixJ
MADEPTVFVVEDDPGVCNSIRWLLESAGLRVETYATGREFLASYDSRRRGCLLVDARLPGLSGLQLHQRLGGVHSSLPIIIMSGSELEPDAREGAVDVLYKPFSDEALLERIGRALDRSRRLAEADESCDPPGMA